MFFFIVSLPVSIICFFFFSSRRRHTRSTRDWSSDVCSSDLGGEPWQRLPLLALGILLAGAAVGAVGTLIGALAREARTASLVAVLVVMPIVFLGLVPSEIVPAAAWVSDALPFVHAVRFFSSSLYDPSPWSVVGREAAWLVGLGAVAGARARVGMRRLAA